jgi:putative ABC transport system permease protein
VSVLARKLRRDLVALRGMLAAVVAIVAFGNAALYGLQATSNNLAHARDAYYAQTRLADFWIDLKKAPSSVVAELADTPGVERLYGRLDSLVIVDLPGVATPISGLMVGMPEDRAGVINDVLLVAGRWLDGTRDDEVVVSKGFADARGLAPGDTLPLIVDGQRKELTLVGIGIAAEFVYLIAPGAIAPTPAEFGVFYVPQRFAEDTLGMNGAINSVVGLLTPAGQAEPDAVLQRLSQQLDPYGVFATTPLAQQASNLNLSAELAGLATMAATMPAIFLSVAALVLNVLMMRLAEQQRTIVGTLKALGYDNRSLFAHFVMIGVVAGLAGGVLGGLLGYGLGAVLTEWYKGLFTFPSLPNRLYPGLLAFSLAIALVFGVLGTLRGVQHVARLSPAEAMRPPAPPAGGRIWLERLPWLWHRVGFFWQTALRSLFRNRTRTLAGVFAAAFGTAMLVSVFGLVSSLKYMVTFELDRVMLADFTLDFRDPLDDGALLEARRLPGVTRAEPVFYVEADLRAANHHHKGVVTGITRDAVMTVPRNADGSAPPVPAHGLLMARRLAQQLQVGAGDSLWLIPTKGTREPRRVPVAGLVDSLFGLGIYADYRWLNALVGETAAVSSVHLQTAQTPAQRAAFFAELKRLPTLLAVHDKARERASLWQSLVVKIGGMSYVIIVFAAVIFLGAILNAALIGLIERRRELATFRVLGYRPGEIGAMLLRETAVVNGLGILLGLPLGWWMLVGMNSQYRNDLYMVPSVITPAGWAWSIGLAVGFVLICQAIVQHRIDRMNWNEALSMKE